MLHWDQSYLKSTLIDEFAKTVPDNMAVANITSLTPQMLFGSITENRRDIVRPAFYKIHFAKISELLSFLGSGNTMKDIVSARVFPQYQEEKIKNEIRHYGLKFESKLIIKVYFHLDTKNSFIVKIFILLVCYLEKMFLTEGLK